MDEDNILLDRININTLNIDNAYNTTNSKTDYIERRFMGVDLGQSGAISIINENQELVYCAIMPVLKYKNKSQYDINKINRILRLWKPDYVMLEKPLLLGVSGKKSYYASGFGLGLFQGLLLANGIKQDDVLPKEWQKHILGSFPKGTSKIASIRYARLQFPEYEFRVGKNYHDGKCDSVGLAIYCFRKNNGVI